MKGLEDKEQKGRKEMTEARLENLEEFGDLTEEEFEMTLYQDYIKEKDLYALEMSPRKPSWYSTPERRGIAFKIIYFKLYYLREKEFKELEEISLRIQNHETKLTDHLQFYVKDQLFKFNFTSTVAGTTSQDTLQYKRRRLRNHLSSASDYHKPELDFALQFIDKVNQFNNEVMLDCVYRAVEDVRSGKMDSLQLVELPGFEHVYSEDQGSFKGIIRAVTRTSNEEVFVPVELCLGYKKDYKYLAMFKPYAEHFLEIQKQKNKFHPVSQLILAISKIFDQLA